MGGFIWFLGRRWTGRQILPLAAVFLLVALLLSAQRNRVWGSEEQLWSDARLKAPLMVRPHLRLGIWHRKEGHLAEAEASLTRALQLDSTSAAVFNNLGNLYRTSTDETAAEGAYRRALAARPSYPEAQINLATLLSSQERYDEAIRLYHQALDLSPRQAELFNNLGHHLPENG